MVSQGGQTLATLSTFLTVVSPLVELDCAGDPRSESQPLKSQWVIRAQERVSKRETIKPKALFTLY